uniref:Nitrilase n=1 Tax=uncultured organism TaxID=155900 RepID=Q6RWF5_9ZZZZ|nr:nitrilase [uncultured organism]
MLTYKGVFKAATVQAEPVWMDADATITKAIRIIEEAADNGAKFVAFPEVFIPGYPWWIWLGTAMWGAKFVVPFHENCLELGDKRMQRIQAAAKQNGIALVMGYGERDGGSRYMSQVFIDDSGKIVANRRKLKPTHEERTIFGEGNGSDFITHDFPFARVGGFNCWEHLQPLSKYMMYSLQEQVHVASWPAMCTYQPDVPQLGAGANEAVTRSYAIEGACYVLGATLVIGKAAHDAFCDTEEHHKLLGMGGGWARIFGPDGEYLAESLAHDAEGILYADIDLSKILLAKANTDTVGHYARPDVLSLLVNTHNPGPVRYLDEEGRQVSTSIRRHEKLEGQSLDLEVTPATPATLDIASLVQQAKPSTVKSESNASTKQPDLAV